MARSIHVYVIVSDGNEVPDAVFTVKHEMSTWLRANRPLLMNPQVWRYNDGLRQKPPVLLIGRGSRAIGS